MESGHSVAFHLRMDTTEYDRIIRTYIPHYDESRGVQLDLLAAALPHSATRIVDLGGGTGSLAEAILERFPCVSVLVRDLDHEMLAIARYRLARFGGRAELDAGSFTDPLPPTDAVVAAFALHHVRSLQEKAYVYQGICQAIRPGGVFLNDDAVSGPFWPPCGTTNGRLHGREGFHFRAGLSEPRHDWAAEDTYFSAREELQAMAEAGFEAAECLWRRGPIAILGARV